MSVTLRGPRKAYVLDTGMSTAKMAWWYEERTGISVFVEKESGGVLACRISREQLESALRRIKASR